MRSPKRATAQCDQSLDRERVRAAKNKVLLERDALLNRIAYDPARRQIRDCILAKLPSLAGLVALLRGLLEAHLQQAS